jgi:hypothetical protein
MSPGLSVAREAIAFCSARMPIICPVTEPIELTASALESGEPTSTAITTSGLQRLRTSSIGRLSTSPPSTSRLPW